MVSLSEENNVVSLKFHPVPQVTPLSGNNDVFAQITLTQRIPKILNQILKDSPLLFPEEWKNDQSPFHSCVSLYKTKVSEIIEDLSHNGQILKWIQYLKHIPIIEESSIHLTSYPYEILNPESIATWWSVFHVNESSLKDETWLSIPWLLSECLVYILLYSFWIDSNSKILHLKQNESVSDFFCMWDPFKLSKEESIKKSFSILSLFLPQFSFLKNSNNECSDISQVREIFILCLQASLLSNQLDLSLLANDSSSIDSISSKFFHVLKSVSKDILIHDDSLIAWETIHNIFNNPVEKIDIIMDNVGLEWFLDLVLGHFLISFKFTQKVVFHVKPIPWFVSDVTPIDFKNQLKKLSKISSFKNVSNIWNEFLENGQWSIHSHPFWVTPLPMLTMPNIAPDLYNDIRKSSLIIWKGDLNYRKLMSDLRWPKTTPVKEVLEPLNDLLNASLMIRILKSNIMVGLSIEKAHSLDQEDPNWTTNGKFGLVQWYNHPQLPKC